MGVPEEAFERIRRAHRFVEKAFLAGAGFSLIADRPMRIGDRVAIGAQSFLGGQGGIEIGDDTVIGGDVTLVAHSAERGDLQRVITLSAFH